MYKTSALHIRTPKATAYILNLTAVCLWGAGLTKTNCAISCEAIFANTRERSIIIKTLCVFVTWISILGTLIDVCKKTEVSVKALHGNHNISCCYGTSYSEREMLKKKKSLQLQKDTTNKVKDLSNSQSNY